MQYTNNKNMSEKVREVRGYAIISKGDIPQKIGKDAFTIPSQNGNGLYTVTMNKKAECTCPDFQDRHKDCKHIHAVRFYLEFNTKIKIENRGRISKKLVCPYCKSENTVGCGKRMTKSGQKQRHHCNDCKRKFIDHKDYERYKGGYFLEGEINFFPIRRLTTEKSREFAFLQECKKCFPKTTFSSPQTLDILKSNYYI